MSSEVPDSKEEPGSLFGALKKLFSNNKESSFKEAIEEALEEHEEHHSDGNDEEKNLFQNLLKFSELKAKDIMIPRTDIKGIEYTNSLDELKKVLMENEHTRIPVYKETLDNVVGFLHLKDLVSYLGSTKKEFSINKVLRKIMVIPPSKKVIDILLNMRMERVHMAIVVDEYGGTDGLITLEDIFEEIVGDIQDEHDEEEETYNLLWVSEGVWEADARVEVEQLEEAIGYSLRQEEDFETIGGLIFSIAGHVPERGEKITSDGLVFEILEAKPRCIKKVKISRIVEEVKEER